MDGTDPILSTQHRNLRALSKPPLPQGIKMAGPYFKIREQFEAHGGVAFSSNYARYGDMSGRVMST